MVGKIFCNMKNPFLAYSVAYFHILNLRDIRANLNNVAQELRYL